MRAGACATLIGLCIAVALPLQPTAAVETDTPIVVAAPVEAQGRWEDDRGPPRRRGRGPIHLSPEDLEGTIWYSEQPHRRVTVDLHGDVEIKEGKEIYVFFKERIDDIFVIEVRWWNPVANLHVIEHGVLTQIEGNQYRYTEADHFDPECPQDEFPGIIGRGTFELLSKGEAEVIQIGHLIDGSASGFTTIVEKVDTFPEPRPPDPTYPLPCD
jgi:hypothetical protein